jgi:hypothetical protein
MVSVFPIRSAHYGKSGAFAGLSIREQFFLRDRRIYRMLGSTGGKTEVDFNAGGNQDV